MEAFLKNFIKTFDSWLDLGYGYRIVLQMTKGQG